MSASQRPPKAQDVLESVLSQMQTLDSKINLLSQKIRTMEKNDEIIGRTLITLNEKTEKAVRQGGVGKSEIDESRFATKQELRELKALLDEINPLEFATIDQVKELLNDYLKKIKK